MAQFVESTNLFAHSTADLNEIESIFSVKKVVFFFFNFINSQPGHRVPRFSTINFGVCVPSTCSSRDVKIAVKHFAESFTNGTGVQLEVRVESEMCYVSDTEWMSKFDLGTKIAM